MSDYSIIRDLKLGGHFVFEKFFNNYKNLVFFECNSVLNDRHDAEDVTQDVFIEFFNHINELKDDINIKLYISSLAKRRAIDLYRKKNKSLIKLTDEIENFADLESEVAIPITLDSYLDVKEAQIVIYKAIYNFTFKEISIDFGMTLGQVQATYYQAIKKLKKYYKKGKQKYVNY